MCVGLVDLPTKEEVKVATDELVAENAYKEESKVGDDGEDNTEEDEDGGGEQLTQFFKERAQTRHSLVSYMT